MSCYPVPPGNRVMLFKMLYLLLFFGARHRTLQQKIVPPSARATSEHHSHHHSFSPLSVMREEDKIMQNVQKQNHSNADVMSALPSSSRPTSMGDLQQHEHAPHDKHIDNDDQSCTSRLSEDQKIKNRARRSSRMNARAAGGNISANSSVDSCNSGITNDEEEKGKPRGAGEPKKDATTRCSRSSRRSAKSSAAGPPPRRSTFTGSVSVGSIDEEWHEDDDADEPESIAVAAIPTIVYQQRSKEGSNVDRSTTSPTSFQRNNMALEEKPGAVHMIPSNRLNNKDDDNIDDGFNADDVDDFHDNSKLLTIETSEETVPAIGGGGDDAPTTPTTRNDRLVDAELIDEELDRRRLQETLQDVLQTQDAVQVVDVEAEDRLKRKRQRRNLCIYLVIAIVVTVVIVTTVGGNEDVTISPTEAPSSSPTVAPTSRLSAVQINIESMFGGPIPSIEEDPLSPQARAIQWLTEDDSTVSFPFDSEEEEYGFYDRYVSAVFAYSTNYENWHDNTNWMVGNSSVCEWHGLSCNDDGRISVMDLAVQNLQGTIPTEIGFLDNLDFVFLFRNSLTGTIPTEMGNLGDVDFMYLNENKLTGSLPDELEGLLDADDLFLFGNQLTGTIPDGFGDLVDLVNLYLHDNFLSGSIPSTLSKLKRLQRLYLNNNKLQGEIPSQLGGIIGLERLQLQQNILTRMVPPELGSFLVLSVLTLQGNHLVGDMPEAVCDLRTKGPIDNLEILEADCLKEVNCTCCTRCF